MFKFKWVHLLLNEETALAIGYSINHIPHIMRNRSYFSIVAFKCRHTKCVIVFARWLIPKVEGQGRGIGKRANSFNHRSIFNLY